MVEGSERGGPESGPGSKPASSFESAGGRLRFTVELRPGETTIVSWKKLLREANLSNSNRPGPSVSGPLHGAQCEPPLPAPPVAPSSSKQPAESEPKDSAQGGSNRLSTVIERIERMYAGHGSGDEEDVVLDNMPDDDEYDTEDSFIDDTELDDYFQVDNSKIKHDGFFVNRGKLERIEPTISANQQPKKRRRKDLTKGNGGSDDGHNPNKIVKVGNKVRNASSSIQGNSTSQSHGVAMPNIHGEDMPNIHDEDMQFQISPANAPEVALKKKAADIQTTVDPSELFMGEASRQDMATCKQRPGVVSSKNHINKWSESELQGASTQRSNDKSSHRKEGSSVRPKSTALDKAIRELEKIVAEFRPPSTEVPDPDNSSQAVKRRLTPEIKQKLAKVARLAQCSYGKIPKDVVNHLMSIVGHLMQIRTLKRNLSAMANTGLSAKQEKDERIHNIKQEVAEMVKLRIPSMKSKVEQQAANSDNFQEAGPEDKAALKRKYSMDDVLENKICDLYDLYAERLEEDSGPPVRRLYEELVVLWPTGFMDIDGIKRAIYRAKDRRGLCSLRKDREKINKKKVSTPKADVAINVTQTSQNHEKLLPDSRNYGTTLTSKPVPSLALALSAPRVANGSFMHKPKQEKMQGSSSKPINGMPSNELPKNKVKRKPNADIADAEFLFERMPKHHKHVPVPLTKSNLQPPVPSGSEFELK
ncbi:hypothetical protein CDL12_10350 [Handroanthus impetiginosus]|uniref:Hpc2-related domain-containing protein n=1 Tax=Handroanthus impetiginosus TaxID=429701 RepID=A0A2G9HHK8_9LAMI|nr:hypothetical protein CDL12_10350 [Handroanthus impetiginosus]